MECIRRSKLVNIAPRFILYIPSEIKEEMKKYYD